MTESSGPLTGHTAASLTGDTALAAAYTVLPPVSGCGNRLYAAKANNYWEVFRTGNVWLNAGESVLVDGQLRTVSSTTTNIMNGWRAYVYLPSGKKEYPASNGGLANGANHVGKCGVTGDTTPCEASLTAKGHWLFTATETGNHQFAMEARAQTTASNVTGPLATACPSTAPVCGGPGQAASTPCHLTIATGSGASFLNVWRVHPQSTGSFEECRWALGYGTANASAPTLTILDRSFTVPVGENVVNAASYVGMTVGTTTASTSVRTRLVLKNLETGAIAYFPSSSGQTEVITKEKHHHKAYLEGALAASGGQTVQSWTEVTFVSGSSVRVDTGCNPSCLACINDPNRETSWTRQVNLSLWP
ncbi:hypothetical protein P2318_02255 [Myxococcaceae bacterium GXIMD 01537]